MIEEVQKGLEMICEKLAKMPPEDAAALVREATYRVNAVADFLKAKEKLEKALGKMPPEAAEKVAENAAMRAEAVADYLESVGQRQPA